MSENTTEAMYFNGIDGSTGDYSFQPMTPKDFSDLLLGVQPDSEQESLRFWVEQYVRSGHYGIKEGHDPKKIEESGWGVIFPHDADPAIIDALRLLLDWRKAQAGGYYKEYSGSAGGFRPNDTKTSWLGRQGASVGPADPEKVPYYLLIVGSPERVPYRFQTLLDVQYGVGRIYFDTVEEYARYAESVVLAEKTKIGLPRKMAFWGTSNADDPATKMSSEQLIVPLLESLKKDQPVKPWALEPVMRDQATKDYLHRLLNGPEAPGLLFTASHGMGFPKDHPKQIRHQGALLCQDWPGPRSFREPIPEDFYFSGDDLSSDANLLGMIAFFFACYGAGTPLLDEFSQQAFKDKRVEIASRPFIASLPARMLSLPKGGALAVIGHVERAWGYSFFWGKNRSLNAFESALLALMDGYPIGYAFEYFNERYAEISTELTDILNEAAFDLAVEPLELAGKWTATNDSKNYVVLGDPAVRLMVAGEGDGASALRPSITVKSQTPTTPQNTEPVDDPKEEPPISPKAEDEVGFEVAASAPLVGAPQGGHLGEMLKKLAVFIGQSIDNAVTLEVRTYTSNNMANLSIVNDSPQNVDLRAMTVVKILGDITQIVPVQDGVVDQELWNIHQETVKQAQANRNELIRSVLTSAAALTNPRLER